MELLLLLLQLDRLDERLLPLHDLALLFLLHALPVPLLPLHLHLLDLLESLFVPPLLSLQTELLGVDAVDEGLLDLLVPHEPFREVSVAEGVHVVGVPRDLALLQPRGAIFAARCLRCSSLFSESESEESDEDEEELDGSRLDLFFFDLLFFFSFFSSCSSSWNPSWLRVTPPLRARCAQGSGQASDRRMDVEHPRVKILPAPVLEDFLDRHF